MYILQWRYHDPQHSHHTFDIIESITTHKAKVMYYYEMLNSQDFRWVTDHPLDLSLSLSFSLSVWLSTYSSFLSMVVTSTFLSPCSRRGSMSSLQSCQSGFSALSIGTTASSASMVSSCPSRWPRNRLSFGRRSPCTNFIRKSTSWTDFVVVDDAALGPSRHYSTGTFGSRS